MSTEGSGAQERNITVCVCVCEVVRFSITLDVSSCLRGSAEPQEVRACREAEGGVGETANEC